MQKIQIKPLSVNQAWMGRRFKTKDFEKYTLDVWRLLPPVVEIPEGKLEIHFIFGLSNINASDWDNPIKPIQDIIAKKYGFNDNRIYRGSAEKVEAFKGEEFIHFEIKRYPQ